MTAFEVGFAVLGAMAAVNVVLYAVVARKIRQLNAAKVELAITAARLTQQAEASQLMHARMIDEIEERRREM